jgi:hypothetical protein
MPFGSELYIFEVAEGTVGAVCVKDFGLHNQKY